MARAWIFQDSRQRKKLGEKCPWSAGWIDPSGKKTSKAIGSKSMAEKYARKMEGQLAAGIYEGESHKPWKGFRAEYDEKILPKLGPGTQRETKISLKHFESVSKPVRMDAIKTQTIDEYIAKRSTGRGKLAESKVSPATVNKELRHIKAVLRVAHDWGYLPKVPKFRMLREPERLPRYVLPDDFAAIYSACEGAQAPAGQGYTAADWWKALLCFAYMTGWRISEIMALRRDDLDLEKGTALTRAESNKGKRDALIPLAPVVVEHLKKIPGFSPLVFSWPEHARKLWETFHAIQAAAVIAGEPLGLSRPYGFHDLRRAFATMNADRMTEAALQALMRHKSYLTTKRYVAIARQLTPAIESLHVPDVLKKRG